MARPVFRDVERGRTGATGPQGPQGERGPAGFNATGAAEDDAAIAAFAGTPGTETNSVLTGAIEAIAEPRYQVHLSDFDTWAEAIAEVNSRNGVILRVPPGTHQITAERIESYGVTIEAERATLELANGENAPMLTMGQAAVNIDILGGRWDGNSTNQDPASAADGFVFEAYTGATRPADRSNIERAEILNVRRDALRFENRRIEIKARRCQIRNAGRHGVVFLGTDSAFHEGAIGICGHTGALISNEGNWLEQNGIYNCAEAGVHLGFDAFSTYVVRNMIDNNAKYGLLADPGTGSTETFGSVIFGNTFLSNSTSGEGLFSDMYLNYVRALTIVGNYGGRKVGSTIKPKYGLEFGTGVRGISGVPTNFFESTLYTMGSTNAPSNFFTAAANSAALGIIVDGESFHRFRVTGTGALSWGTGSAAGDTNLFRSGADQLKTDDRFQALRLEIEGTGGAGYLQLPQQSSAPVAGSGLGRLFTRDNGSGKTELCVRFPTGAVQVIATEP